MPDPYYQRHIFFCLNDRENGEKSCAHDGAKEAFDHCKSRVKKVGLARPGKVCRREHLMDNAYELHKVVSDRTIDSHVRRVRAKFSALGVDPIETVHGIGYKLGPCT